MKFHKSLWMAICTCCALAASSNSLALASPGESQPSDTQAQAGTNTPENASADAAAVGKTEGELSRWLTLNAFSFSYRYRRITDNYGSHLLDNGQERTLLDGKLKLDEAGKYSVNFHLSSGNNFNWAYTGDIGTNYNVLRAQSRKYRPASVSARISAAQVADPAGTAMYNKVNSAGWAVYTRELYLSATPIKQFTLEYGGLGFERGVNTEITSYDEDGYLEGERLRIRDPQHLFFDQIAVTYGYVGDYFDADLFDRGNRFAQSNYHQYLVQKSFGHRLKASADYTWQNGVDVMREALLVHVPEVHVVDGARLELYQRLNNITLQKASFGPAAGVAASGMKTFNQKFQLEGGYASIDPNYAVIEASRALNALTWAPNADSFSIGNRLFARGSYKVAPGLVLFGFYTHSIDTDFYNKNREGINYGMTVEFKDILNHTLHLGI